MPNDPVKEKILEKADIVDIVSGYLKLEQKGGRLFGLCPFHKEKTPSFSVHAERGFFHCFGCGQGGNVIDFIMGVENLTFGEARRYLATKLGIPIESYKGQKRDHDEIDRYQVMDHATQLYCSALRKNESARDYLYKRSLTDAHIKQFSLGYSPQGWDNMARALKNKGIPEKVMEELGLVIPRKQGQGYYDRFRHRIMFPIRNTLGRVIAFGGRALDPNDNAKYLNTNDTSLFNKSKVLYLMDQAKGVLKEKGAVLVEGYMDAISLHAHGFNQTIANLGTSLTKDHANILRRYTTSFTLIYDGDEAGVRAAMRGIETFLEIGYTPKVVLMPDGSDPDDYVRSEGKEALQSLIDRAQDGYEFYLMQVMKHHDRTTTRGKTDILNGMLPLFQKITEPLIMQDFTRSLAGRIGSDIATLERSLQSKLKQNRTHAPQTVEGKSPKAESLDSFKVLKEDVIRLLALHHGFIEMGSQELPSNEPIITPRDVEEIQSVFHALQKETTRLNRILEVLLSCASNQTQQNEAVKMAELFPGNEEFSAFLAITEQSPLPSTKKDLEKMRDEIMTAIRAEKQKRMQTEIIQTGGNDPDAALKALNELLLKDKKVQQS